MKPLIITKFTEAKIQIQNLELDIQLEIADRFSFLTPNHFWAPSFRSGSWNGTISLYNKRNNTLPFGLIRDLTEYLDHRNIPYVVDENCHRVDMKHITDDYLVDLIKRLKCEQQHRDYQLHAVKTVLKQNKSIFLLPTGSGKSFCYYLAVWSILEKFPDAKILIIVPTIGLVDQMEYDFLDYDRHNGKMPDMIAKIYGGQSRRFDASITVSTWQSLQDVQDKEFFDQFDGGLFVDEVHGCVSEDNDIKQVTNIIMEKVVNAKFRIGMSGSIHDGKIAELQLKAYLGKINSSVTTADLIKQNYLSPVKIKIFVLKHIMEDRALAFNLPFPSELAFITKHTGRMKFLLRLMKKINNGNSLIIFKTIKYGKLVHELLVKKFPERTFYYIDGSTKPPERERIRLAMADESNACVLASAPLFAIGVNMPSLKYLINAQPYKSKIKVIQAIGRTLRKHKNKDEAIVIDIVDDLTYRRRTNYVYNHAVERLKIYQKEQFEYSIQEIELKETTK
jgi:superfamily II DNA or RNA helicase